MLHDPNCRCGVTDNKDRIAPTRREFLCLAVGGAVGVISAPLAANATGLKGFVAPPPTLRSPLSTRVIDVSSGPSPFPTAGLEQTDTDVLTITLPKSPDMHTHLRQGDAMKVFVERHLLMGNDIILAMPNTAPPVNKVTGEATEKSWSIESYLTMIKRAGGDKFRDVIVPLYLTADTTSEMIEEGAKTGLLRAVKYYPPNVTTNTTEGLSLDRVVDSGILKVLERHDIVFCLHGEQHGLKAENYFDKEQNAETIFYREKMPRLVDKFPNLRISCEHLTTAEAVKFVQQGDDTVVGTVTPQHLLYTVGHLLQTWHADLFCRPLVKFEEDRAALLQAVTSSDNYKFIAGTDSAPHPRVAKSTPCGCAAGCYVGGIAPQLYAQAFESAGVDFSATASKNIFRRFMAENAWRFWRMEPSHETMLLVKKPSTVTMVTLPDGQQVEPLPVAMMSDSCAAQSALLPWSLEI